MIESLTFNTAENKLVVKLEDGTEQTYIDAATYLIDQPDRPADVVAMGWEMPAPSIETVEVST